jgi:hypothetical protein
MNSLPQSMQVKRRSTNSIPLLPYYGKVECPKARVGAINLLWSLLLRFFEGARKNVRDAVLAYAGQCEPVFRLSLPGSIDGGSPSLGDFGGRLSLQRGRDGLPWLRS